MHWSDVVAQRLSERGQHHIVSTGITPSGEFHIGHLREILTGDMIAKAAKKAGLDVEFVFIVDSADPLRKVYSFLDDSYSEYIGHQLKQIPPPNAEGCPDMERFDQGISYADHFLEPFRQALEQIDVRPRFIDNYEAYANENFAETARIACNNADKIREIIERVSGRELSDDWFPWNPIDSKGSIDGIRVTEWNDPIVSWIDAEGNEGTSDVTKGEGKLPWRIDWPAKWAWIGVTMEPFGKDHGAAGGSFDTGKEIVELFGKAAPVDLTYEWISLRGQGAMSSSSGNTIGPLEALSLVPPEILRYLVASTKPNKAIEFDTGMGLVNLADEFERTTARDFSIEMQKEGLSRRQMVAIEDAKTALELSLISPLEETSKVTFRHLAMLAQTKSNDEDVWTSLGLTGNVAQSMIERLDRMRTWIQSRHFPDELRITILEEPDLEAVGNLDDENLTILPTLIDALETCEWDASSIQSTISNTAKSKDMSPRHAYRALYLCIMGTERGPRLPTILTELDQSTIVNLLRACLEESVEP
jgi:lysyl-tRNA synthetase class 1